MAMTTTVEKILAKAQEFEANAKALRLAASLLNGHVREGKIATMEATLAGAVKLRREQKDGAKPQPTEAEQAERREQLRQLLQHGPRGVADMADATGLSRDSVYRLLQKMPEAVRRGHQRNATWTLAPTVAPHSPKRTAKRTPRLSGYKATRQRRAEKAEKIAIILKEAGQPLSLPELKEAAAAVGITSLTGIKGLVRKGLIKQHGKQKGKFKYSFLQLPSDREPDAADAPSAS